MSSTPEERELNVFDMPIEEMSTEYLAETTDQFAAMLITTIAGEEALKKLDDEGAARYTAVMIADRFIKMMYERSIRVTEHQTTVDWLNSLL